MIIKLPSVEGQASSTDERYLLIITFWCKIWPKVIRGEEFKSKVDFELSVIDYL